MKGILKEVCGGLAVAVVICLAFFVTVFGAPQIREQQPPERVSAGVSSVLCGGWADTLKAHEEQEAEAARKAAEEAKKARRAKAPAGVPQKVWGYCLEFETEHISAYILAGVAKVESDFNAKCITGKCYGLMQIHSVWEFDRFRRSETWDNPRASVRVCAEILNEHWQRYKSVRKALQVYNMGWVGERYDKTSYSDKVIKWAEQYKRGH